MKSLLSPRGFSRKTGVLHSFQELCVQSAPDQPICRRTGNTAEYSIRLVLNRLIPDEKCLLK